MNKEDKKIYQVTLKQFDPPLYQEVEAFDMRDAEMQCKTAFREQFPDDIDSLKNWKQITEINEVFEFVFDLEDKDDPNSGISTSIMAKNIAEATRLVVEQGGKEWLDASVGVWDGSGEYLSSSQLPKSALL